MEILVSLILFVVNFPLYLLIAKIMYGGWDRFIENIRTPNHGWICFGMITDPEQRRDWLSFGRFMAFLLLCYLALWGEYKLVFLFLLN